MYREVQQFSHNKTGFQLDLQQISPKLAKLSSSTSDQEQFTIPIPGSGTSLAGAVMLRAIDPNIFILPTKTRPKKLIFIGTDGKKYPFAFKGISYLFQNQIYLFN